MRFTVTQAQRLRELGAPPASVAAGYADAAARDAAYKELERDLSRAGREQLQDYRAQRCVPPLVELERRTSDALIALGFARVVTPLIISSEALARMGIDQSHPLRQQVFWLDDGRCLRPMLAPNLYALMRRLGRLWSKPFGLLEIGPCFRRDTKGANHLNEFTMLNLVEVGGPAERAHARLEELAATVMKAAGIDGYRLVGTQSEVYGTTIDVEVDGVEVCSAAAGPHPLDGNWGIVDSWVGLGFGLERLLAAREGYANIERAGRSLSYVDGVRLTI